MGQAQTQSSHPWFWCLPSVARWVPRKQALRWRLAYRRFIRNTLGTRACRSGGEEAGLGRGRSWDNVVSKEVLRVLNMGWRPRPACFWSKTDSWRLSAWSIHSRGGEWVLQSWSGGQGGAAQHSPHLTLLTFTGGDRLDLLPWALV